MEQQPHIINEKENKPKLSEILDSLAKQRSFGEELELLRIDSVDKFLAAKTSVGMDSRAKQESEENIASVFEGVEFDSSRVRTQSYELKEGDKVVAVMTVAIEPKIWIDNKRYLKKVKGGVVVCDFQSLTNSSPDFLIVPAWAKVDPQYLTKFALPGFRLYDGMLKAMQQNAPENTWLEITAQGTDTNKEETMKLIKETPVGTFIPSDKLPFDLDQVGVASSGSVSTCKMAELLKVPKIEDVGSANTLGPVYANPAK